jgi:hypothetical protein
MIDCSEERELKTALAAFETSLATPVISGELESWIEAVRKSWAEASAKVRYCLTQLHPRQYEQMGKEDPELLPRIERLQAEDRAIETEVERLSEVVSRAARRAPKLEPDEEKALGHIKKLVDEGMAFVARLRKQEVALRTWYIEAFTRDRGAVD